MPSTSAAPSTTPSSPPSSSPSTIVCPQRSRNQPLVNPECCQSPRIRDGDLVRHVQALDPHGKQLWRSYPSGKKWHGLVAQIREHPFISIMSRKYEHGSPIVFQPCPLDTSPLGSDRRKCQIDCQLASIETTCFHSPPSTLCRWTMTMKKQRGGRGTRR
jgi:hypothetical protein